MDCTILLVEDDPKLKSLIAVNLQRAGYNLVHAESIAQAASQVAQRMPDVVLLDSALPATALAFVRRLRADQRTRALPIMLMGAGSRESDAVAGLEAGADDYLAKPVYPRELLARIKAIMRRCSPRANDDVIEVAGLRCDPVRCRITGNGRNLDIGGIAFRLLRVLMTDPGRVYSRAQLLNEVWREDCVAERTVDVHIRQLRQALAVTGHAPLLEAVRGAGYRFCGDSPERGLLN